MWLRGSPGAVPCLTRQKTATRRLERSAECEFRQIFGTEIVGMAFFAPRRFRASREEQPNHTRARIVVHGSARCTSKSAATSDASHLPEQAPANCSSTAFYVQYCTHERTGKWGVYGCCSAAALGIVSSRFFVNPAASISLFHRHRRNSIRGVLTSRLHLPAAALVHPRTRLAGRQLAFRG